jgi:NAD-dependent DNA ligase
MKDNPGSYYHRKNCEARYLRQRIKSLHQRIEYADMAYCNFEEPQMTDSQYDGMHAELKHLRARLESAEYMGD